MSEPKPKIIVDDDWKSKVEAEKQVADQQQQQREQHSAEYRVPPASFAVLVSTLTSQALVSLGQIPDPYSGQAIADLEIAKHFIDTLAMLEEKTRGNLSAEEKAMLDDVLHQLRLAFVAVQKGIQSQAAATGNVSPGGIELP
jgi:hypothetical protein